MGWDVRQARAGEGSGRPAFRPCRMWSLGTRAGVVWGRVGWGGRKDGGTDARSQHEQGAGLSIEEKDGRLSRDRQIMRHCGVGGTSVNAGT